MIESDPTLRRRLLLAALSGALIGVGWMPLGLAPTLPLAFLPFLRALRGSVSMRQAVWLGIAAGTTEYLVASHFLLALMSYSWLAVAYYLMATCYILPYSLLASCGSLWLDRRAGLPRGLGYGLLFTAGEWLRSVGDLSFPADPVAHAFGTAPAMTRFTSVTGPLGVTLWMTVIALLLDAAWRRRDRAQSWWRPAAAGVSIWLLPLASLVIPDSRVADRTLRIGIVQPAVDVATKLRALREGDEAYWLKMQRLTREAASGADLVVWPETARPERVFFEDGTPFHDPTMERLAADVGVPILYGAEIARVRDKRVVGLYNGAAIAHPDGAEGQWYGKQRLLPFVEGMPFGDWFGYDPGARAAANQERSKGFLTLLGNFSRGPEATIFRVGDARIGILICYEGMYTQLAREYSLRGANLLVVMTNDLWFGRSIFPAWHAQMVASRANETGLPVVRAANSGISSYTDLHGRLQQQSEMMWSGVMRTDAQYVAEPPVHFYVRIGNWPIVLIWLVVGAAALRAIVRPRA